MVFSSNNHGIFLNILSGLLNELWPQKIIFCYQCCKISWSKTTWSHLYLCYNTFPLCWLQRCKRSYLSIYHFKTHTQLSSKQHNLKLQDAARSHQHIWILHKVLLVRLNINYKNVVVQHLTVERLLVSHNFSAKKYLAQHNVTFCPI